MWEPLPLIVYGYAIHPLSPFKRETRSSVRNRFSTATEASTDDQSSLLRDVVSLEVGDEVYAFEKYTPSAKDIIDGPWYRECVHCPLLCSWTQSPVQVCRLYDSPSSCLLAQLFPYALKSHGTPAGFHWHLSRLPYLCS